MGRITVFVSDDCSDSQDVLNIFRENDLPFEAVSLSRYPEKRGDMIRLSKSLMTPQIFFNDLLVGDKEDFTLLLDRYKREARFCGYSTLKERISIEVLSQSTRNLIDLPSKDTYLSDDDLSLDTSFQTQSDLHHSSDYVQLPNGTEITIERITRDLVRWLQGTRLRRIRCTRSTALSGNDIIAALMKHYSITDENDAIELAATLVKSRVLHQKGEPNKDGKSIHTFHKVGWYNLQPHMTPNILNSLRVWTKEDLCDDVTKNDPSVTLSSLMSMLSKAIIAATDGRGIVDYKSIRYSNQFKIFEDMVCRLQLINPREFDHSTKLSFFINLYNLLKNHIIIKFHPKKKTTKIRTKLCYNVGGYQFSLDHILHGILRANSKAPKKNTKVFPDYDIRSNLSLSDLDPRIHFALHHGLSADSLTLYQFHSEAINEELYLIAKNYCADENNVSIEGSTLFLPNFLQTFQSDFTGERGYSKLPRSISTYLQGDKQKSLHQLLSNEMVGKTKIKIVFRNVLDPKDDRSMFAGCTMSSCIPKKKHRFTKLYDDEEYSPMESKFVDSIPLISFDGVKDTSDESSMGSPSIIEGNFLFSLRGSDLYDGGSQSIDSEERMSTGDTHNTLTPTRPTHGKKVESPSKDSAKTSKTASTTQATPASDSSCDTPLKVRSLDDSLKIPALDSTLDSTFGDDEDSCDGENIIVPPRNNRLDFDEALFHKDWDFDIKDNAEMEGSIFSFDEDTFQSFTWSDAGKTDYDETDLISVDDHHTNLDQIHFGPPAITRARSSSLYSCDEEFESLFENV